MKNHSFVKTFLRAGGVALALACASLCLAQDKEKRPDFVISPDHTNGIYSVGETVHWRVQANGTNASAKAHYTLLRGERTKLAEGDLKFDNGVSALDSKIDAPEHLVLEVRHESGRKAHWLGGAIAGLDQIKPSAPRPDDFDGFWQAKLKELAAVPAHARLESVDSGKSIVVYWRIRMDNIRGSHIYGQIARPAGEGKYPAMLLVQQAGVYALPKSTVVVRAAGGWLALNIQAHDMPLDASDKSKAPEDYPVIGNDDRDQSYFLRMYLSCYQAVEYLRSRPDWDGKVLVVSGGSQGGLQTLMVAGLHPGVTAALARVPAGCDMLGPEAGRKGGWPQWYGAVKGKDARKVHEASRYYDVCNFVPHIKCPVLVGIGLIDEACPPEGILAAYNLIPSPKQMVIMPVSGHIDVNNAHQAFRQVENVWLSALRQGKPAPVGGNGAAH